MNQICYQYYKTDIGELLLASFDNKLCMLDYKNRTARKTVDNRIKNKLKADFIAKDSDVLNQTRTQLNEYLKGQRKYFTIPLLMLGTEFQLKVWQALVKIPYGSTTSYLNLATKIDHAKAVRAVANANAANAISVIIPCHRVIGNKATLVGYAGGLEAKQTLLNIERPQHNSGDE